MKTIILVSIIMFFIINIFPQSIGIHSNVEGNIYIKMSEIDSITFLSSVSYEGKLSDVVQIGDQLWLRQKELFITQ